MSQSRSGEPSGLRFVGGMFLPFGVGDGLNATRGFAELLLNDGDLILRPRWLRWLTTEFRAPLDDVSQVFALRSAPMRPGIGISTVDGQVAYFWTAEQGAVLEALASVGLSVDPVPHSVSIIHRRRRYDAGVPARTRAGLMSPLMVRIWPWTAVLSVGVLLLLEAHSEEVWFRWLALFTWVVAINQSGRLWWRSRRAD